MAEKEEIEKILKDATINEAELSDNEKTAYQDYLLANAKNQKEEEQIKETINNFLEIYEEQEKNEE